MRRTFDKDVSNFELDFEERKHYWVVLRTRGVKIQSREEHPCNLILVTFNIGNPKSLETIRNLSEVGLYNLPLGIHCTL